MPIKSDEPRPFSAVLAEELTAITGRRKLRGENIDDVEKGKSVFDKADRTRFTGLAFSGGGIRSATFNLGVLQALAKLRLLPRFDYLSTVSGGGYIGSWLVAWVLRSDVRNHYEERDVSGLGDVGDSLCGDRTNGDDGLAEPRQVHFLREYSNYLTPRKGLTSGDTLAAVATYLRNLALTLLILTAVLTAIVILPRIPVALYREAARLIEAAQGGDAARLTVEPAIWLYRVLPFSFLLSMFVMITVVVWNLARPFRTPSVRSRYWFLRQPAAIRVAAVGFTLLAAWIVSIGLWAVSGESRLQWYWWTSIAAVFYLALWLYGFVLSAKLLVQPVTSTVGTADVEAQVPTQEVAGSRSSSFTQSLHATWLGLGGSAVQPGTKFWLVTLVSIIPGAFAGILLWLLAEWIGESGLTPETLAVWGLPFVIGIFVLAGALHVGLAGRAFDDDAREWWSRLGGELAFWTLLLVSLAALSFYGPDLTRLLGDRLQTWVATGLTSGWILVTVSGLVAGRRETFNEAGGPARALVGLVAPWVFVLGLLLLLASLANVALPNAPDEGSQWMAALTAAGVVVALVTLAVFLSSRIGVNEFSMHELYRNRLVRCYLGASNSRRAHPYTGFDPTDNAIRMSDLDITKWGHQYSGPYPIINTALNLVSGDELAWQQRKAASFVFTPKYCGYEVATRHDGGNESETVRAYRPTEHFGGGVSLGTAMTISGAAASPSMGHYTTKALAFLMAVFNVRLGWWFGNPRGKKWTRESPKFGVFSLLRELSGRTSHKGNYVYLSDGGHFENLGIYELVRRRCRFIVACDAEEDREMTFPGLGNAIEKCRIDFGVDIDIDVSALQTSEDGVSRSHCAIGKIHYPAIDGCAARVGTLVYMKSSLTGDEPTDVKRYAAHRPHFPHQSTADQWFDESQFESYRALGKHVAQTVFGVAGTAENLAEDYSDNEALFTHLRQYWYPASTAIEASFTKHAAALSRIRELIRQNEQLRFLDAQLFPEWSALVSHTDDAKVPQMWLPTKSEEVRAGFYVCAQMLQLMQNVYLDLNLEAEREHPDNRGWMNLFRQWASSNMMRVTWAITASYYGARFQNFCERHLQLVVGRIEIEKVTDEKGTPDQLDAARQRGLLNLAEARSVERLFQEGTNQVVALRLALYDPADGHTSFKFTFGVALLTGQELRYFRIRDHLRKMRLGRNGLKQLFRENEDFRIADDEPGLVKDRRVWQAFKQFFWSVEAEMKEESVPGDHGLEIDGTILPRLPKPQSLNPNP